MTSHVSTSPLPASMRVREARDVYLRENGFSVASYAAPSFTFRVLGIRIRYPNPPSRQRVMMA